MHVHIYCEYIYIGVCAILQLLSQWLILNWNLVLLMCVLYLFLWNFKRHASRRKKSTDWHAKYDASYPPTHLPSFYFLFFTKAPSNHEADAAVHRSMQCELVMSRQFAVCLLCKFFVLLCMLCLFVFFEICVCFYFTCKTCHNQVAIFVAGVKTNGIIKYI